METAGLRGTWDCDEVCLRIILCSAGKCLVNSIIVSKFAAT